MIEAQGKTDSKEVIFMTKLYHKLQEGEYSQTAKSPDACVTINENSQGATYRGYTKVSIKTVILFLHTIYNSYT